MFFFFSLSMRIYENGKIFSFQWCGYFSCLVSWNKRKKKTAGGSFYSQISILFENLIKVSSVLSKTNITNWKAINYWQTEKKKEEEYINFFFFLIKLFFFFFLGFKKKNFPFFFFRKQKKKITIQNVSRDRYLDVFFLCL